MPEPLNITKLLLLVAGARGAIGATLAVGVAMARRNPEILLNSLTTESPSLSQFMARDFDLAGWDILPEPINKSLARQGVLPESTWKPLVKDLKEMTLLKPPRADMPVEKQVERVRKDIQDLGKRYEKSLPVLVNLLPAGPAHSLDSLTSLQSLYALKPEQVPPDLIYALGAVLSGVPVVNFTPNTVEIPVVIREAINQNTPVSGRDGKTGQTYLKLVLASALKVRKLRVNGWYSLNILGNADGKNLMNPENAKTKLMNKTGLLEEILGYPVGDPGDESSHKIHIDYYPPRGDAKEAWDVIDFEGFLGMPMSLRLNFQGRDSILAAPLVLDLCRWMAALKTTGRAGLVPELAFFYKKPVGEKSFFTFQDQLLALKKLEKEILARPRKAKP